jgi:hypothetical protein
LKLNNELYQICKKNDSSQKLAQNIKQKINKTYNFYLKHFQCGKFSRKQKKTEDWINNDSVRRPLARSCEHGDEPSGSITDGEFLD